MIVYGWILAYSIGLISLTAAIYFWTIQRNRADGLFALFLALFFLHTFFNSFPLFSPDLSYPRTWLDIFLHLSALGIGVTLPLYFAERTGKRWMILFWKAILALSALLFAFYLFLALTGKTSETVAAGKGIQLFISIIILVSVLPLVRGKRIEASQMPPKAYRLAGFISIFFAAVLILLLVPEMWGVNLRLNQMYLYLGFYALLNIRFIALLLPKLMKKTMEREKKRDASLAGYAISPREMEIYDLLAKGYTYKEIGRLLNISLPTVKTHVDHLYKKTGTGNKVELIREIEG